MKHSRATRSVQVRYNDKMKLSVGRGITHYFTYKLKKIKITKGIYILKIHLLNPRVIEYKLCWKPLIFETAHDLFQKLKSSPLKHN